MPDLHTFATTAGRSVLREKDDVPLYWSLNSVSEQLGRALADRRDEPFSNQLWHVAERLFSTLR